MSRHGYTRLSAQDNDFLRWESRRLPMHGVSVQILSCGPLARGGGVNFEAIREAIAGALPRMPRYRQKIALIPGSARAVWVDDEHFQLEHHLRHVAVARRAAFTELVDACSPKRAPKPKPEPAPKEPQPLRALGAVATSA